MVELTGARECYAGDDFHFNWAEKILLKLLEPNTDIQATYVEGASCSDNKLFEDDESVLQT